MNSTRGSFNASVSVYPSNDTSGATNGTMIGSGSAGSTTQNLVTSEGTARRRVGAVQLVCWTAVTVLWAIAAGWRSL